LKNIYFDYNKATLLDESNKSLNELLEQMNAQPKLKIKIKGHTSTEGDAAYNLKLSQNRAKAVRDYLLKNGVKTERVQYEGYGETVPIGPNDTEEDRAKNRRVEFEILEK
jgi:outer membrane protein OmpA-like peptidoglycan-associated protein